MVNKYCVPIDNMQTQSNQLNRTPNCTLERRIKNA